MSDEPTLGLPDPVLCDDNGIPLVVRSPEFRDYVSQLEPDGARALFERVTSLEPGQGGQRLSTYLHLASYGPLDADLVVRYTQAGAAASLAGNRRLLDEPELVDTLFQAILEQWERDANSGPLAGRLLDALEALHKRTVLPDPGAYRDLIIRILEGGQGTALVRSSASAAALRIPDMPSRVINRLARDAPSFPRAREIASHPSANEAAWRALLDYNRAYARAVAAEPRAVACESVCTQLLATEDAATLRAGLLSATGAVRGAFFQRLSSVAPEEAVSVFEQDAFDVEGISAAHMEALLGADDRSVRERAQVHLSRLRASGRGR